MSVEITGIGNEGFKIVAGETIVYVDAFYTPALWVGSAPYVTARDVKKADLILVTHRHPDHFDEAGVADVAARTGAKVVGPASVIGKIKGRLPKWRAELPLCRGTAEAVPSKDLVNPASVLIPIVELEPALLKTGNAAGAVVELPLARITAFRTFHSPDHNSYLVEMPGFRFFHDGDNEDCSRIEVAALGRIDALFIATWQGAQWVEFIEAVKPVRWLLMHMTDEELAQQKAGTYLPDLCDHVPAADRLVALGPGESFKMP